MRPPVAPAPPTAPPPVAPFPIPGGSATAGVEDLWSGFVAHVKAKKVRLGSFLEHGHPFIVSSSKVEAGFPADSFYLSSLTEPESLAILAKLASEFFGGKPEVRLIKLTDSADSLPPTVHEKKKLQSRESLIIAEGELKKHPLVAAALEIFGGPIELEREEDS